ncbi:MAG TPA: TRAM domain-containing protein, partial [Terriglobales bacterium]|nr:TRAM domain-containing protein [Terriglobales bacterium]
MNLIIEKMVYGGDGLARLPDGKAAFLPFVLPGEEVSAAISKEKSSFARAQAEQVLKPSPQRVAAPCPYFGTCGGCHYQHTNYKTQLEFKSGILHETLLRNGKLDWKGKIIPHSGEPWSYRNRTRMKVRGGAEFALGYYRFGSHELLPVKECPISSPAINRVLSKLWQIGEAGGVPKGLTEIEFFADHADARLLLEISHVSGTQGVEDFAGELRNKISDIQGIAIFSEAPAGSPAQPELKASIG